MLQMNRAKENDDLNKDEQSRMQKFENPIEPSNIALTQHPVTLASNSLKLEGIHQQSYVPEHAADSAADIVNSTIFTVDSVSHDVNSK